MKFNFYILLLSLFLFFISCSRKKIIREIIIDESLFKTIQIDPNDANKKNVSRVSEIADSISFIALETRDDVLIGEITNSIHNLGYFLIDDFNTIGLPPSVKFVDEKHLYLQIEPDFLLNDKRLRDEKAPPSIKKILSEITETNNPILVKIKLK